MPVGLVERDDELSQILVLQKRNRAETVDGFVTVEHTLEILREMHALMPSVVARDDAGKVVGYAISMPRETEPRVPVLGPMFVRLAGLPSLANRRWYVMGQICVAEGWRGKGLFDAMYAEHRARYSDRFDDLVTEIAVRNGRSMRAHARVGFREIDRYRDATDDWSVVGWSWR